MQVLAAPHRLSLGLPSPTLTNPDMILPVDNDPSSQEPSLSKSARFQQLPYSPSTQEQKASFESMENRTRLKHSGQSLSPFRNGVLSRGDGPNRVRSYSERGNGRIRYENSRLSYRPSGEGPVASSPTLGDEYDNDSIDRLAESPEQDDDLLHNTYKTPSILQENEDDPDSHAAMTKRAEEILANAKRRLTNMEGNLNRARSTLSSRPSSSMSSFADREPVSLYTIQKEHGNHGGISRLKHRQVSSSSKEDCQGHARVFSETSVPSSLQTSQSRGNQSGEDAGPSMKFSNADAAWKDRNSEPTRSWFWNGLNRSTSLANRHNNGLQPLKEDGPAPDTFEGQGIREEEEEEEEEDDYIETRRAYDEQQISTSSIANATKLPTSGLTRAKSTTQMRDLREQVSDLKGKITTLKQRAREDSLRRRSLQSLRTPSPLNSAQQDYSGVPLAEGQNRGTGLDLLGIASPGAPKTPSKARESTEGHEVVPNQAPPVENGASDQETDKDSGVGLPEEPTDQMQTPSGVVAEEDDPAAAMDSSSGEEASNLLPSEDITVSKESNFSDEEINLSEEEPESIEDRQQIEHSSQESEDSIEGDQAYSEPVGERHEDRADAFDYEHFFLHSSMGHYGRNRSSTHSSNISVETEKPAPHVEDDEGADDSGAESPGKHGRQNSTGSVSTVATFATATEGRNDSEEDERTPRQTMSGGWQVESPKANGNKQRSGKMRSSPKSKEPKGERPPRKHHQDRIDANGVSPPAEASDILTFLASLASESTEEPTKLFTLSESDKELAERVIISLAGVCRELHYISNTEGTKYEARICRRKLDTARRHLDGEVNGEAF